MKHPAWIAADIVGAVAKTRGQIIDWADEIERGITTALDERDARIAELEAALKVARRVADAAVAVKIAGNASCKLGVGYDFRNDAFVLLAHAESDAVDAFDEAVREYRASVEAAAINTERGIDDERRD